MRQITNFTARLFKSGFIFLLILFSPVAALTSCSMKAQQQSLTDQFITIDNLISQNQSEAALKELKAASKRCYDKWSYIGLYKRYARLAEPELAEKALTKAIKDLPEDMELTAVYTDFLINNKRYGDAVNKGESLRGTEYAGLYSEAVLKQADAEGSLLDGFNKDLYSVYFDAYTASGNPLWIRNCGVFDLINGNYSKIPGLVPEAFKDENDAYFWALAMFDAGHYYDSIEILNKALSFIKEPSVKITALLSDAYMSVADMDRAEQARQKLILNIDNVAQFYKNDPLLSIILTNSAVWAYNQGFYDECADLLFYIVNTWPDYVPGLVLYTDFAWNSNIQRKESNEQIALRKAGIYSLEMEHYDSRRKIPLSDALYRVEESLKRTNDPYLNIVKLDLKYKLDPSLNDNDKNRDLWNMLEDSYRDDGIYQSLLIQYGLNSFLKSDQYNDALGLFQGYIGHIIELDSERPFWEQVVENAPFIDSGILNFAAYFAAAEKQRNEALRLHEYIVYESSGILEEGFIAQNASTAVAMNLGDIYYSIGRKEKALDLYGRLGGRESNKALRSEIFYRIACIYTAAGDIKNALRSAEYACEIYPENVRASLLKDKLN